MGTIKKSLELITNSLPTHVKLVAVTKTKPTAAILEAYNAGHKVFGENKVQEMAQKFAVLPKDIEWHMIGHLQRNKIKYLASFVHLIHGVDSVKTLNEINKQAVKHGRVINCLLQLKIASEETKFGMSIDDAVRLISSPELSGLKNISIKGLMGMASFTDNEKVIRTEFKTLKNYFNTLQKYNVSNFEPSIISMGMSGDYKIAIEEGSTMIRVGSAIFGDRSNP